MAGWSGEEGRRVFLDRAEAGRALAERLAEVVTGPCVVAAIPRGGVVVARPIATRLSTPLTLVYAHKLSAPFAPELAFGAMDEDGEVVLDPRTVARLGLDPEEVEEVKARVAADIRRRMARYGVPPLAHYLPGPAVVLVDDGLATGLTMRAALAYARRHGAAAVTVAVPCAAAETAEQMRREADRFESLIVDPDFVAVGAYYLDFAPVSDEEVLSLLAPRPARPDGP
ncbi:MAG TPA: phosphoribosyltransferase family protein, partial [Thermodesulfobacteriota bacterium]|nr:phosphoribosyltransferase family protein [Thermodesulfobacteriota bacterium]